MWGKQHKNISYKQIVTVYTWMCVEVCDGHLGRGCVMVMGISTGTNMDIDLDTEIHMDL